MPDYGKVVNGLESCLNGPMQCEKCRYRADDGTTVPQCVKTLKEDAITLLKAQGPRVMTLEEAGEADVCWLEIRDSDRMPPCRVNIYHDCFSVRRFSQIPETLPKEEYGRLCRCWSSRPTDEQREAVKWE